VVDAEPDVPRAIDEPLVEIKVRDHGPYKVTGRVRLIDADGDEFVVEAGGPIALCRCGQSRTKPFCDASHKESGFESCVRARQAGV
jgi:CDGSH-type Zn-finger protein